jgi:U4/U6 small nuclear ribonucleoprotein PRP31
MSALADDLLNDLDGLSDDGEEENQQEDVEAPVASSSNGRKRKAGSDAEMSDAEGQDEEAGTSAGGAGLVLAGGIKPAEEFDAEDVEQMQLQKVEDVTKIAKLEGSKKMTDTFKVRPQTQPVAGADMSSRKLRNTRPNPVWLSQ